MPTGTAQQLVTMVNRYDCRRLVLIPLATKATRFPVAHAVDIALLLMRAEETPVKEKKPRLEIDFKANGCLGSM